MASPSQSSDPGFNFIFQRNDKPPPEDPGSDVRVDGISIGGADEYFVDARQQQRRTQMSTIFRGPEHLDVITDARVLPTVPPAGLMDLGIRSWQVCDFWVDGNDCDGVFLSGLVTSVVAVPEPGTYALMALGLAAVGVVSRRRRG